MARDKTKPKRPPPGGHMTDAEWHEMCEKVCRDRHGMTVAEFQVAYICGDIDWDHPTPEHSGTMMLLGLGADAPQPPPRSDSGRGLD